MQRALYQVPVGVSNRHVHLSRQDLNALFGNGYQLTPIKDLQPGQYAAQETVTLAGPKGIIENVRILGPVRPASQIELSRSDCFKLGIKAPLRDSGELEGTPGCVLIGPKGAINLAQGVMIAVRHIHMHTRDAQEFGLNDGDRIQVRVEGERAMELDNVLVRVSDNFALEMHIDTDEANAAFLNSGDLVEMVLAPVLRRSVVG